MFAGGWIGRWRMKCPSVMQKSTLNGSHGVSIVDVIEGKGVGGNDVLVGMTFVFTTTGVSVTSTFAQDTRINGRRILNICFIMLNFFHREEHKGISFFAKPD